MSLQANDINKPSRRIQEAAGEIVKGYIKSIDEKIKTHEKKLGWNVVYIDIPTFFPIGLDKLHSQYLVYSMILKSLEDRKIEAKLKPGKDSTQIVVRFEVTPNTEEIDVMKKYIQDHILDKKSLDDFIRGK